MQIKTAAFLVSSARIDQCPNDNMPEYAFIGRSNVGKSSLINMLTGNGKLAKTSSTPGKTVLINHFVINGQLHVCRILEHSKKDAEKFEHMITTYILDREQMTNLFLLIDVRHEPQKIDMEFIEWLGENGVPFSIVFTKADKVSKARLNGNVTHYLAELKNRWEELPPYFVTSSETKMGREEILNYIEEINKTL